MAKQTFTTGQVLTAAQMTSLQQTAMLGGSASAKVANYTLVAADAGTTVSMSNAGATTITVNTGLFAAGDTVTILNTGVGTCTITAGTATVSKPTNATLALVTSAGGVLYFTATGTATFLPFDVGAGSSTPTFKGVALTNSAVQTIGTGSNDVLTFDTESFDTDAFHSTSVNTSRITIPAGLGGYYRISAEVSFASNATGLRSCKVYKNGVPTWHSSVTSVNTGNPSSVTLNFIDNFIATDYLTMIALQTSGGNLDTVNSSGGQMTFFQAQYLGV
jgi:hypothetical protein